jgi:hypothetical protein
VHKQHGNFLEQTTREIYPIVTTVAKYADKREAKKLYELTSKWQKQILQRSILEDSDSSGDKKRKARSGKAPSPGRSVQGNPDDEEKVDQTAPNHRQELQPEIARDASPSTKVLENKQKNKGGSRSNSQAEDPNSKTSRRDSESSAGSASSSAVESVRKRRMEKLAAKAKAEGSKTVAVPPVIDEGEEEEEEEDEEEEDGVPEVTKKKVRMKSIGRKREPVRMMMRTRTRTWWRSLPRRK